MVKGRRGRTSESIERPFPSWHGSVPDFRISFKPEHGDALIADVAAVEEGIATLEAIVRRLAQELCVGYPHRAMTASVYHRQHPIARYRLSAAPDALWTPFFTASPVSIREF